MHVLVVDQVPPHHHQVHALPMLLVKVSHSLPAHIQNTQPERLLLPRLKRFRANLQGVARGGDRKPARSTVYGGVSSSVCVFSSTIHSGLPPICQTCPY